MFDDTSLVCLVIEELVKKHNWSYEEALDKFYTSEVCMGISDHRTGMFTFSPKEIIELLEEEYRRILLVDDLTGQRESSRRGL